MASKATLRSVSRQAFGRGALPFALLLTFVLLPSTSNRIFKTFLCESFVVDENGGTARFLVEDLAVNCESDEYNELQRDAVIMIFIWPVGVPLFYAFLLYASRRDLREGLKTDITSAGACELAHERESSVESPQGYAQFSACCTASLATRHATPTTQPHAPACAPRPRISC